MGNFDAVKGEIASSQKALLAMTSWGECNDGREVCNYVMEVRNDDEESVQ